MRCFIALDINNEISEYLTRLQKEIPKDGKIKLVKHFHITLFFLRDIQHALVEEIKRVLSELKFRKINVKLGKLGFFPSESYIRVIYIDVKDKDKIKELYREIATKLKKIGLMADKEFKAHITLARVKMLKNKKIFMNKLKEIKSEAINFELSRLTFYESVLKKEGPEYKEILTIQAGL